MLRYSPLASEKAADSPQSSVRKTVPDYEGSYEDAVTAPLKREDLVKFVVDDTDNENEIAQVKELSTALEMPREELGDELVEALKKKPQKTNKRSRDG